jgi:hypothetical protein
VRLPANPARVLLRAVRMAGRACLSDTNLSNGVRHWRAAGVEGAVRLSTHLRTQLSPVFASTTGFLNTCRNDYQNGDILFWACSICCYPFLLPSTHHWQEKNAHGLGSGTAPKAHSGLSLVPGRIVPDGVNADVARNSIRPKSG